MSLSKEVRKSQTDSGNSFPNDRFADRIAVALHSQYGDSHGAIKSVMRLTGVAERTVKNWFQAKNGPSGESLVQLCRHSDQVLDAVLLLAGRERQVKIRQLNDIKATLKQMLTMISELESR